MWLINLAMRRPITILVVVIGIALCSILALTRMAKDIFPNLNLPVIYVAQPYGGMDPAQMEGYLVSYYEYHFLFISGIEHIESKSIQNMGLIKIYFHPGTDMGQAWRKLYRMWSDPAPSCHQGLYLLLSCVLMQAAYPLAN